MDGIGVLLFIGLIVFAIVMKGMKKGMGEAQDGDRVRKYVSSKGGHLLEKRLVPMEQRKAGEKNVSMFQVRYLDSKGNEHEAVCKSSGMMGFYFSEDRIITYTQDRPKPVWEPEPVERTWSEPPRPPEPSEREPEPSVREPEVVYREDPAKVEYYRNLEEENQRLREEVERLKTRLARGRVDNTKRDGQGFLRE